jgi:hypothetical protein
VEQVEMEERLTVETVVPVVAVEVETVLLTLVVLNHMVGSVTIMAVKVALSMLETSHPLQTADLVLVVLVLTRVSQVEVEVVTLVEAAVEMPAVAVAPSITAATQ